MLSSVRNHPLPLETAVLTAAGSSAVNEDACGYRILGDAGCWVLCDGLGGHGGGGTASRAAVDAVLQGFEKNPRVNRDALAGLIEGANRAVLERQRAEPEISLMRTTIVALLADGDTAFWAHAGDSRLYHFRNGRIVERTRDHSVPQRLMDAGEISEEQIRFHEERSRLLLSLGNHTDSGATFASARIGTGDAFLLASDGFWGMILEPEMEQDLAASRDPKQWLARMEARLRERIANDPDLGEVDDYSAIAVVPKIDES